MEICIRILLLFISVLVQNIFFKLKKECDLSIYLFIFNDILSIMLLQFQFYSLCPPPSTQYSPHHCSCPWVMCVSSSATPFPILYCTSPWLSCNYLFVLFNPLTSSPFPPHPPAIWQPSKCSPDPWFCLWTCLLSLFLDSIVDRYVLSFYCSQVWSSFS